MKRRPTSLFWPPNTRVFHSCSIAMQRKGSGLHKRHSSKRLVNRSAWSRKRSRLIRLDALLRASICSENCLWKNCMNHTLRFMRPFFFSTRVNSMLRANSLMRRMPGPFTRRKKNYYKTRSRRLNRSKVPRRRLPQLRMRCRLRRRSICRRANSECRRTAIWQPPDRGLQRAVLSRCDGSVLFLKPRYFYGGRSSGGTRSGMSDLIY